jgi:hypothetical protein
VQGSVTSPDCLGYAVFPKEFECFLRGHIVYVGETFYSVNNEQVFIAPFLTVQLGGLSHGAAPIGINLLYIDFSELSTFLNTLTKNLNSALQIISKIGGSHKLYQDK